MTPEEMEKLRRASAAADEEAGRLLKADVDKILARSALLAAYKPNTADEKTYQALVKLVNEARADNELAAGLQQNIEKLGTSAVSLCKTIAALA